MARAQTASDEQTFDTACKVPAKLRLAGIAYIGAKLLGLSSSGIRASHKAQKARVAKTPASRRVAKKP